MAEGFLGRWARRKQDVRDGRTLEEPALEPVRSMAPAAPTVTAAVPSAQQTPTEHKSGQPAQAEAAPPPTLEDALQLTPQSDFKPFVGSEVAPEVRNAAMKKLFADPHFNVMDGLDIYIDDYSIPSPLPTSMMRRMVGAQMLNLFDEDAKPAAVPATTPLAEAEKAKPAAESAAPVTAQSEPEQATAALPNPPIAQDNHANPDLRLQPDHAAGAQGPGRGAG
ncbi:MAG: DUF3306 domain-containing protein [Hylemonella sp.]